MEKNETTKDMVAYLEKSLYGTRDAALNFQKECKRYLESLVFF